MTIAMKAALSLAGLSIIGSAALLWDHFGTVILFDMASAAFLSCF